MGVGSFILPQMQTSTNEWQRPVDWLPMPTNITSTDQIFVGLHAVIENSDNYCAFSFTTSAGQYQVDWGDGNVTLHNSGTIAQYQYNYATVSNSTLSSRGYKQVLIKVTPVSGNLLGCDFQRRFVTTPAQNQPYSSRFLDCILSMPNASSGQSIIFGGGTIRHSYCEKVDIKTIGGVTNMNNMFQNCYSLQSVPLFDTQKVTNMGVMFQYCSSLQSVPLFNTQNVTNMNNMFQNCTSLQSVPLFNTQNVTNMGGMFQNCSSLQSVPLFNTQNVTNMGGMFQNCSSLQSVPLFDTQNVTNMGGMFQNCSSLQSVPLFNTQNVTNIGVMLSSCYSLQSVPLFNTQKVTSMFGMFEYCSSLQSVPLFNTQNVTAMNDMFYSCTSLQSVPLFDTRNVTNMFRMFIGCSSLNFIPNFNTTSATNFMDFANNCSSLDRCTTVFRNSVSLQNCQLSRDALVEIFTNLVDRTSTTSATINITGNWGASALTSVDRLIATNKNWVITG